MLRHCEQAHCHGEQPIIVPKYLLHLFAHSLKQMDLFVDMLANDLALWQGNGGSLEHR